MIKDALDGKIDLIITKSVSRFARNTVDSLVNIRKLKDKNVECYFEKENIYTFDSKGELLITIMSSLAQEESRSISENMTWGQRKRFADGKFSMHFDSFLGYKKGINGEIEIDEEEAKVVRLIYKMYLDGATQGAIAKYLDEHKVPRPNKVKSKQWLGTTITSILTNERYKGDALLQKTYVSDFLMHKTKKNNGEIPQYYVHDSHPAIVTKEDWDLVQIEMKRRKQIGRKYQSSNSCFSSKLICEDCGAFYGQKLWHSNDKGRKFIWQCNDKFKKNKEKCSTPNLSEDYIKRMFVRAYFKFMESKGQYLDDLDLTKENLCNLDGVEQEINERLIKMESIAKEVENLVKTNASTPQDQMVYYKNYAELEEKYNKLKDEYDVILEHKENRILKAREIDLFIHNLQKLKQDVLEFDEGLWNLLIENVIVHRDKSMAFRFKSGIEIKVEAGE